MHRTPLSTPIFRSGRKKAKGERATCCAPEDIRSSKLEGMQQIWVAELDPDEINEDEAVCGISAGK